MTERQKRFADEYIQDLNATRAYKVAYPNVKRDETACQAGSRLLRNVNVRLYVDENLKKIHEGNIASAEEVLAYLTSVVRGESESEIVVIEGQGVGVTEARHLTKAPDEKERLKAAELMAKYHQLLIPKVQVETEKGGGVIILAEATEGEP